MWTHCAQLLLSLRKNGQEESRALKFKEVAVFKAGTQTIGSIFSSAPSSPTPFELKQGLRAGQLQSQNSKIIKVTQKWPISDFSASAWKWLENDTKVTQKWLFGHFWLEHVIFESLLCHFRVTFRLTLKVTLVILSRFNYQEWPRKPNQRKVSSWTFHRGIPEQKFNVNRACFPKEKHQNSQKWRNSWTFRFGPFFGLVCRFWVALSVFEFWLCSCRPRSQNKAMRGFSVETAGTIDTDADFKILTALPWMSSIKQDTRDHPTCKRWVCVCMYVCNVM